MKKEEFVMTKDEFVKHLTALGALPIDTIYFSLPNYDLSQAILACENTRVLISVLSQLYPSHVISYSKAINTASSTYFDLIKKADARFLNSMEKTANKFKQAQENATDEEWISTSNEADETVTSVKDTYLIEIEHIKKSFDAYHRSIVQVTLVRILTDVAP